MASASLKRLQVDPNSAKGNLGDFQHASRLFVDNDLRLAPKSKFNFHVVFSINPQTISDPQFLAKYRNEINMLVKKIELPKFSIQTETLNQYNRKKVVQVKSDFKPISLSFHDDNEGVTRQLWENYYRYYYADYQSAKTESNYNRSAMRNFDFVKTTYGFDNGSSTPFFSKIAIYHMAKHKWNSYTLINPVVTEWTHEHLDYSVGNQLSEHHLSIAYEAVSYNTGIVAPNSPHGFAVEHYDQTPSSIYDPADAIVSSRNIAVASETTNGDPRKILLKAQLDSISQYNKNKALSQTGKQGSTNTKTVATQRKLF